MFQRLKVMGFTRLPYAVEPIHGSDVRAIEDTTHAEDVHYHEPSGLIFTAAERDEARRLSWFPPLGHVGDAKAPRGEGTLVVIDPKTSGSKILELEGFSGPFITHGIDIWSPADDPETVYILAVNHRPNTTGAVSSDGLCSPACSRLELFCHVVGSSKATHVRSVWDPLIRTPNDVLMVSPTEFWVTNDHYYREGAMRTFEDFGFPYFSTQTDTVHVSLSSLDASNDSDGVIATVACTGLNCNNGLSYGKSRDEVVIGLAPQGVLKLAKRTGPGSPRLEMVDEISVDSSVDNPSYFKDVYAQQTGLDASGYIVAGLLKAATLPAMPSPSCVWHVRRAADGKGWIKQMLFQDEGTLMSTAATGLLVPLDPAENGGKKLARLIIGGFMVKSVIACTVDLTEFAEKI